MAGRGLVKQKEYDWQDSNLALFGSDVEKNVKKEAASSEVAWKSAGKRVGLQIWRIEQFKVKTWPRDKYGEFYDGDSYIILNTYKDDEADELKYDVHFWIGEHSTQDEYGTAAYKTVELDTFLDDKAIQHREVMGHESQLFKSYFKILTTMKGGVKSGFKNVLPDNSTQRRLLRIHGTTINNCKVEEVTMTRSSLTSDDVFILDYVTTLYQWNGANCDKDEKFKAGMVCREIKSKRTGTKIEVYDEFDLSKEHPFYKMLGDKPGGKKGPTGDYKKFTKTLLRYSEPSPGRPAQLREVAKGNFSKNKLDSNDVFLLDTGEELFIWIGARASVDEKRTSLQTGHNYLRQTNHQLAAITTFREGDEMPQFTAAFE